MIESVGTRIRYFRERAGWSQVTLAETLHITVTSISRWENDKVAPRSKSVRAIASHLGIPLDYLRPEGLSLAEIEALLKTRLRLDPSQPTHVGESPPFFDKFKDMYGKVSRLSGQQLNWLSRLRFHDGEFPPSPFAYMTVAEALLNAQNA